MSTRTRFYFQLPDRFKTQLHGRWWKSQRRITVVTAPVDVDAAAIGAGELGQREAGWVGWRGVKRGYIKIISILVNCCLSKSNNVKVQLRLTTGVWFIWAVSTVVIQVTCPGDGDAAPTSTRVLIWWACASWQGEQGVKQACNNSSLLNKTSSKMLKMIT